MDKFLSLVFAEGQIVILRLLSSHLSCSLHREDLFPSECETKKADVVEYPEVFHHVGLLLNELSGKTGLLFD